MLYSGPGSYLEQEGRELPDSCLVAALTLKCQLKGCSGSPWSLGSTSVPPTMERLYLECGGKIKDAYPLPHSPLGQSCWLQGPALMKILPTIAVPAEASVRKTRGI